MWDYTGRSHLYAVVPGGAAKLLGHLPGTTTLGHQ